MGASKYIAKIFQKEWAGKEDKDYNYKSLMQQRTIDYRKENVAVVKIDKPTNLASARSIGYKAKQGIFVARVRVRKGHGTFERPKNKRRPKRQGQAKLTRRKSTQSMAEEKASKKFSNAEAIGSYKIGEDGQWHYFEVVLADRDASTIKNDNELAFLVSGSKGRAERGKNYSGRVNKEENKKNTRKRRRKQALDKHFG